VVLEVKGLSRPREYEDIDLTIRAGEVVGLTGLIGAGRTELGHTLFGMTHAARGEIRLNGKPVSFRSNRDAIRAGVAYVSEDRRTLALIAPQSVGDNSVISVLGRHRGGVGLLPAHKTSAMEARWIRDLAIKIGRPEDAISTLAGGNQQRVVLAKWLATEPKLL